MNGKEKYIRPDAKLTQIDLSEIYMLELKSKSRGNDAPGTKNGKWNFEEQEQ